MWFWCCEVVSVRRSNIPPLGFLEEEVSGGCCDLEDWEWDFCCWAESDWDLEVWEPDLFDNV